MFLEVIGAVLIPPLIWIIWVYIKHLIDCLYYPRGPIPLPFIGNGYLIRKAEPYKELVNLGKIYGDVFSFSIGSVRFVIVNSLEGIQEVLVKKGWQFAGRPKGPSWDRSIHGLIQRDPSKKFKILRKLATSSLKIFADGLAGMESKAIEESFQLNKKLLETNGKPFSMQEITTLCVLNIICSILFNHRYKEDDLEFQDIIKYSNICFKERGVNNYIISIPWLRYFPSASSRNLDEMIKIRDPLLKKKVQEHKRSYDENNLRDLTDALIKASNSETGQDPDEKVTDDNIEFILNNFILAGSETSSNTILWFIVYILHWPEYQDKLYDEILKVTSGSRYPCLKDRPSLHLMQAAIYETLRLSSVAPFGLHHKAMEKSSICGKSIPKGALIITNLWSIHHDESYWKNAMSFYPERWLESSGEFNSKLGNAYLPFSSGPRSCIGETLAKTELFIFISRLINDFRFVKPISEELPRLDGSFGITCTPYDFKVEIVPRSKNLLF
ncbi:steroid 17-alpha-hydroxylase/17,20 lyase [Hydra vulgaris]|uniref:steroid 17-alpha-hydroxylase/17,20 lyase n=1 Tax=Hydra vulgaris TaxID=6087 RepID=UPI0006410633|nr:steroid 17-alpha-hydroxylase/17,20 lyase [Hydra vulgaris]